MTLPMRIVREDGTSIQAPHVPKVPQSQTTLREAFHLYVRPRLIREQASPHSLSDFRGALRKWEDHTADPPLATVDDADLQAWADALLAWYHARGFSGYAAVIKNLRYLKVILRAAQKKQILQVLPAASIAAPDPEETEESGPRRIDLDEISAAYEACEVAQWPKGGRGSAPELWRLVIVLGWTFGPRRDDLLGLSWENVTFAETCPHPKYKKKVRAPHGWLFYLPSKTKKKKPSKLYLPLTPAAAAHLQRLHHRGASGPIFGFPRNDRDLHETRRQIWRATGMTDRPYDFRDLRFTCSCEWNDLREGLGEHVTGHAPRGVNARHYDQWLRRLVRHMPELPQPAAFLESLGTLPLPQPAASDLTDRWSRLPAEVQAQLLDLGERLSS